jgi:hypothetical protein
MSDARVLNSWKEISSYIGRGVRTVQRWEEHYGLPVHRPSGRDRSAVYAIVDEIDAWLRAGATHQKPAGAKRPLDSDVLEHCRHLIDNSEVLRNNLKLIREHTQEILEKLARSRQQNKARASNHDRILENVRDRKTG